MNAQRLAQLKNEYAQSQFTGRFDEWLATRLEESEKRTDKLEKQLAATQAFLKPLSDWKWEGEL